MLEKIFNRRTILAGSIAAGAVSLMPSVPAFAPAQGEAPASGSPLIRPFRFRASDESLRDLKRRIAATRWASRELVSDASQGVQSATMQKLARYWHDHH